MKKSYELIIIGGGPAGLTSAIYSARRKIDTLLVTKTIGGQTAWSSEIENYPGFGVISGTDLVGKFRDHVKQIDDNNAVYDLEVKEGSVVVSLEKLNDEWLIKLDNGDVTQARCIIVAAGKVPRQLHISGEEKFIGHGVTFCATCDAPLYRGKVVAVIGGGNSALDATLQLAKICPQVYLITINPDLRGEQVLIDEVLKAPNIKPLFEHNSVAVLGEDKVTHLKVQSIKNNEEQEIAVQGVFEEIGYEPATDFLHGIVALNEHHEVIVDNVNRTSAPGILAAGDITNVPEKQIVIAAGEGCKAALQAQRYLRGQA